MKSNRLARSAVNVIAGFMLLTQALYPAMVYAGPRDPRGTQLGRGGVDPGRPMITACIVDQPCPFVGLVDPDAATAGLLYLDGGYFTACVPGACGTPIPFLVAPVAAAAAAGVATGLSTAAITGITVGSVAAVSLSVGLGVGLSRGSSDDVPTPSQ